VTRPRPQAQKAPPPRPRRALLGRLSRAALLAALPAALAVFHIWSHTRVVAAGYALGALQQEHTRLSSEHDRLRVEVESLREPAGLLEYARTRLGMTPPVEGPAWAANPRTASAVAGRAGVDGGGRRSPPAGSARSDGRAARGGASAALAAR
jgi:cell division protein FtsL